MSKVWNFKQELTGCFGKPVAENPTQVMVEAAYRHHGLNWRYLTIEVAPADLADAVRGARAMGFAGFNCTIPHKVAVIPHLDEVGDSARLMGAVNCVVRKGNQFVGENTDGKGFVSALQTLTEISGRRVVLFGAGGAARAISVELALARAAAITVVNRTLDRGSELVNLLNSRTGVGASVVPWRGEFNVPEGTEIVVNATAIGLFPDVHARLPINMDSIRPGMIVADVIPNPPRTRLVREAEQRGCRVIDGLGMLVNQGVIGIQYWTGITPDAAVMRRALEAIFNGS
ncbi:MAG TPA: shikimate dehydrogenase [Gemmataceae bacterium]|nr:shikimate dehydrogenase [Gemmataceae bacterium]